MTVGEHGEASVVRFRLRPGESPEKVGGKRAELTDEYSPPLGREIVYEFALYVPSDFPEVENETNSTVLAQWHTEERYKPPLAFRFREGRLDVTMNLKISNEVLPEASGQITIFTRDPFPMGEWHFFRIAAVWATDARGKVAMEIDGKAAPVYRGPTTYPDQKLGPYFKYGLYVSRPLAEPIESFATVLRRRFAGCSD